MRQLIKNFATLLVLSLISVVTKAQVIHFTINIASEQPWPNSMVFLSYVKPGDNKPSLDSMLLQNGIAKLSGIALNAQPASIYIERANKGFVPNKTKANKEIFLEKGILMFRTPRNVRDAHLSGTSLNDDMQSYQDILLRFKPSVDSLKNLFGVAYRDRAKEDLARLSKNFKTMDSAIRISELEHFKQKPKSLVSLMWLKKNINVALDKHQAQTLFSSLDKAVQTSAEGKAYREMLMFVLLCLRN